MDQASGGEDPNKPSKKKSSEDEGKNKKLNIHIKTLADDMRDRITSFSPDVRSDEKGDTCKENEAAVTLMLSQNSSHSLRNVVIDCSAILFLDTAGVNALKEVHKDYAELGVKVVLAQCNTSVLDTLEKGGYFPDKNGANTGENKMIFFTIADAVHYVQSLRTANGDCDTKC